VLFSQSRPSSMSHWMPEVCCRRPGSIFCMKSTWATCRQKSSTTGLSQGLRPSCWHTLRSVPAPFHRALLRTCAAPYRRSTTRRPRLCSGAAPRSLPAHPPHSQGDQGGFLCGCLSSLPPYVRIYIRRLTLIPIRQGR